MKYRVCVVGSGNWGSTIAKIIGKNVKNYAEEFEEEVRMYVHEEKVDGKNLSDIINEQHENVRYLPGIKLPDNVVAVTDPAKTAKDADIFVIVLPHEFVGAVCKEMKPGVKSSAFAVSLIKGVDAKKGLRLISSVVEESLDIPCSVLMGANLANEVSKELFCEATIGTADKEQGMTLKKLFQTDYFKIVVCCDKEAVEICGALKNIVATGAGFIEGLGLGNNTKAAVIRIGLMEIIKFTTLFYSNTKLSTFFESCGMADIVTTCYAGRNQRVAAAFAKHKGKKSLKELEKEILDGQHAQGIPTAAEVHAVLKSKNLESRFPLFTAVYEITQGSLPVEDFVDILKSEKFPSIGSLFNPRKNSLLEMMSKDD